MRKVLVSVDLNGPSRDHDRLLAGLTDDAGRPPDLELAGPESAEIDAALTSATKGDEPVRLVLDADLAGLSLVLTRMRRLQMLTETETAVLPRGRIEGLTRRGIPTDLDAQLAVARSGSSRIVGAIYDDSGGVCLDSAVLTSWATAGDWWVRAVVDDQRLCDGAIRSLTVHAAGPDEVVATVRRGRLRTSTIRGRALQLACDEAQIVTDGVARSRPRSKRTFWSEPKAWRLALPG